MSALLNPRPTAGPAAPGAAPRTPLRVPALGLPALALLLVLGAGAAAPAWAAAPGAAARPGAGARIVMDPAYTQMLRIASRQSTQGQHAAALETYRQMLQVYPNDPVATRGQAEMLVALGRMPEAEALLKAALTQKGHDEGLRQTLAEIHRSQQKFDLLLDDVITLLGQTDKTEPLPMAWAQKTMEDLAGQTSVAARVEPAIRKLVLERKDRPELRLLLAEALIRRGDVNGAYLEVTDADRVAAAGGNLLFQFADGLYSQGLSEMAGSAYRKSAETATNRDARARAWHRASEVAVEGERWSEAVAAYQGLAAIDPKSPAGIDAQLTVANIQQSRLRNYQAALGTYQALMPSLSGDRLGKLYLQMADCYLRMNRVDDAKTWLGKVKASPADQETQAEAAFLGAEILFFSGDFATAQTAYEDLAQNFTRTRKTNDAVGRYLQIVKFKDLGQQEALKVYARMEEANRMGDTTAVITSAHRLQQDYAATDLAADALVREAEVLRLRRQSLVAAGLCQRAADEHPKARIAPYALSVMGYILQNDLSDSKGALAAWEKLLANYPEHILAAQIRRTVERMRKTNES